jgi:hypothetical protein
MHVKTRTGNLGAIRKQEHRLIGSGYLDFDFQVWRECVEQFHQRRVPITRVESVRPGFCAQFIIRGADRA